MQYQEIQSLQSIIDGLEQVKSTLGIADCAEYSDPESPETLSMIKSCRDDFPKAIDAVELPLDQLANLQLPLLQEIRILLRTIRRAGLLDKQKRIILDNLYGESTDDISEMAEFYSNHAGEIERLIVLVEAEKDRLLSRPAPQQGQGAAGTVEPVKQVEAGKGEPVEFEGEWSKPMSKVDIMQRLGFGLRGYRKLETYAKSHPIKEAGNRQLFQIRIDSMPSNIKMKFK